MKKYILSFFIFINFLGSVFAQRENLAPSLPFFEKKKTEYQHWLDAKGIGSVLGVELVRLKVNRWGVTDSTELEMFLLFKAMDVDTAMAQWGQLKIRYGSEGDSLEAYLFRTFIHFMEIPEIQGNIQIYLRNSSGDYIKGTHIFIYAENDQLVTQKVVGTSRSGNDPIVVNIAPCKASGTGRGSVSKVATAKRQSANQVFNRILLHVKTSMLEHPRYKTTLNDRWPHIEPDSVRTATTLKFTVADMGKEVLTDQERSFWEPWVGVNTIAMERLTFEFKYTPDPKPGTGYSLSCTIEGKFGSGVFKPRKSGYMNMQPDFDDFFENYKTNFKSILQTILSKP